jgi:multidrug efflux pump subunit AcrB
MKEDCDPTPGVLALLGPLHAQGQEEPRQRGHHHQRRAARHQPAAQVAVSQLRLRHVGDYRVLVAQFQSFIDPLIILLAVPTGIAGAILILLALGTTLNVMSLMGFVMLSHA